jgi:hypothetical protein
MLVNSDSHEVSLRLDCPRRWCCHPWLAPKHLFEKGGELALQEISRKKPVLKNRDDAIIALDTDNPPSVSCASPTS